MNHKKSPDYMPELSILFSIFIEVKPYVLEANKNFKTLDDLLISIAESTVASFKLEGIIISFDEAYKMALASEKKRIKKHK